MMNLLPFLFSFLLFAPFSFAIETNFIALDPCSDRVITETGSSLDQRMSPCCTFNIALSAIGFDLGILQDEIHPVWLYNGENVPLDSHKAKQSPKTWMDLSVVWYSKRLSQKIGKEALDNYTTRFSYGNKDISGDPGKGTSFTTAHLSSTLKISPREQLFFIKKLIYNQLPVSLYAAQMTKQLLYNKTLNTGWKLFGKTGSGFEQDENSKIAWYVGWIKKEDQKYLFALLLRNIDSFPSKEERQKLVINFFQEAGAL